MKPADKVRRRVSSRQGGVSDGAPSDRASRMIDPGEIGGDAWAALVRHARNCAPEAYRDLHVRLSGFRHCFAGHLFADPEEAYGEFVRDLVDGIRYGFVRDPESLLTQARSLSMRKTADRIGCLTAAARVLSAMSKRDRDLWIRSQLALQSSPGAAPQNAASARKSVVLDIAGRRRSAVAPQLCATSCGTAGNAALASLQL